MQGNVVPSKTTAMIEAINDYSSTIFDELTTETTAITGGKRWWGWSTERMLIVGLIALCILAIILVLLFLVLGKKFKKNKKSTAGATTTKAAETKGVPKDPKYQPVPNV
ncbi:unnamed protein product [Rotaria socialis]|nr:unnamed protein product [Rotaria socialis]